MDVTKTVAIGSAAIIGIGAGAISQHVDVGGSGSAATTTESPLSNEVAVTPMAVPAVPAPSLSGPAWETFQRFAVDAQSAAYYAKWLAANCGAASGGTPAKPKEGTDAAKWRAFRDAIFQRQRPPIPAMATRYGQSLVDAGWIVLNV